MDVLTIVKRSPFVLPLAFLAAVAMVFISEGSYWQSVDSLNELGAMGTARTNIQNLQKGILAAEAGQRGYLLTSRKEYLQPYEKALEEINESFASLGRYYGAETQSIEALRRLRALIDLKLSELAVAIRLHDEGQRAASTDIVLSELNKKQMDAIRAHGAELIDHEALKVAAGRNDIYQTLRLSRVGVALLSGFSLLALVMYLLQSSALDKQRQLQQHLVKAERNRLEVEVAQRTAELTKLTHHLQTAREDERSRLARDLHDELGAFLTSAKLDAARIKSRLAGSAPEALERLNHLVETLNSGIAMKRRIIEDLRPSALGNLGLVAALEILTREFAEQSGIEVHTTLEPVALDADAELVVYRLLQEAITNISKYAKAKQVWVSLTTQADRVQASVRDDGVGFDAGAQSGTAHGLVGMRFRVEAEGGTLALHSAPGQGTTIQVSLPAVAAVAA